jgi:hypothetical protein
MGTTNTTTGSNQSTLQFNPASQSIYNMLTGGASQQLQGYINSPFSNPQYNLGAAQSQKGAQQAGQNNMAALQQSMLTNGLTGQAGAGFKAAQTAQTGRANQAMGSQANVQNILAALQRQQSAIGTGLSFSPQLTGQTGNFNQSSQQSGLGTWLPQVLGAGLGAAMGGLTGGAGGAAGGAINAGSPSYMPGGGNPVAPFSPTMGLPSGSFAGSSGLAGLLQQGNNSAMNPYYASMFPQ